MSGNWSAGTPHDAAIRNGVSRPDQSFLVRAPAGAGKTQLLAERYVRLLAMPDVEPENIISLSFTRKAAGEMRDRITSILAGALEPTSADDYKRRNAERICDLLGPAEKESIHQYGKHTETSRINVQTIDGFQRTLVRADSFRAGVMPHFGAAEGVRYYNRAVARGMKWPRKIYDDQRAPFSGMQVHRKLVAMLRKRDQWMSHVQKNVEPLPRLDRSLLDALWRIADKELDRIYSMEREYDYIAISRAAKRLMDAVATPAGLEDILGYSIRHILVDEFQDVSAAQCEFLEALVSGWDGKDGRSFFAVGDSMQSIYRFRGAGTDVIFNLFEAQDDGGDAQSSTVCFGGQSLQVKRLTVNFRSGASLVNGVCDLLEKTPVEQKDRLRIHRPQAHRDRHDPEAQGEFRVWKFTDEKHEATWVAREIERHRDAKENLAVLVRARSYYSEHIQPMLNDKTNIDVAFAPLDKHACVRDMVTLGQCIDDIRNEAACLALLRSPLIGIGSEDIARLFDWLKEHDSNRRMLRKHATPIEKILNEELDEIQLRSIGIGDVAEALLELVATVWRTRAEMHRMSVRERLERAWLRMGGGVIYSRREDVENVERLLDLVEDLNGGRKYCDWRELESAMRLRRGVTRYPDAPVKIMTIHAAKGLEFENVIVPFLHKDSPYPSRDLVMFREGSKQSGTGPPEAVYDDGGEVKCKEKSVATKYAQVRCAELARDKEEIRRLLYVAATRAKEKCYLTFTDQEELKAQSMLGQIGARQLGQIATLPEKKHQNENGSMKGPCGDVSDENGHAGESSQGRRRVGDFRALREHMESKTPLCGRRSIRAAAGGRGRAALGEVVHEEIVAMLEEWPADGVDERLEDEKWWRACGRTLQEKGWRGTDGDVDEGVEEIAAHLRRVSRDRRVVGRLAELMTGQDEWSLEFEKEFQSEEDLCEGEFAGRVKRLDLVIWNKKRKKCLVIDFKTGKREQRHKDQVKCYKKFVTRACRDFSVGTALYYTSIAELDVVSGRKIVDRIFNAVPAK